MGLSGCAAVLAACSAPSAPAPTAAPAAAPTAAIVPKVAPTAASAPTAAQAAAGAATKDASAWQAEWDQLVKAAEAEGSISIVTRIGDVYRNAIMAFEEKFPAIHIEHQGMIALNFGPRVIAERKAGQYSWDVLLSTATTPLSVFRQEGILDPVRPLMFRSDVLDDSVWQEGFEGGWRDNDKKWAYAYGVTLNRSIWINTDMVKDDEIKTTLDLLDPKWKGKIVAADPRIGGFGNMVTIMRLKYGDDVVAKLYKDQEVVVSQENRQTTEWLVRGRYPVGVQAVNDQVLQDFRAQGIGNNVKHLPIEDADYVAATGNIVFAFNKAPHPNAAKLFVNWLLTQEGQTFWCERTQQNSRRIGVPPGDPQFLPTPGKHYYEMENEEMLPIIAKTNELAKAALEQ
ncbi:MAG TPA: extracellular solute-binding protein [Chloroflexota bacterium]|nr:extracellular solute-binding protein [Chloroflexota bacterium]